MRILNSQVNKPEDKIAKAIQKYGLEASDALANLQSLLNEYKPSLDNLGTKIETIEASVKHLEQTDNTIDYEIINKPLGEQLNSLKETLSEYHQSVNGIEIEPKVDVHVDAPDLTSINESFKEINTQINELFRDLDLMERPELKDYFKKILDLLEKINNKTWNIIGGGGGQTILQGYEINTGNLVNITAVESADTPGIYGVLALNADGSAIGSGGGVVETFKRITENGDIRVTANGDTRVYSS